MSKLAMLCFVYSEHLCQTTKGINEIIERDGNQDDLFAFLVERNIPADEMTLMNIAEDLLKNPPHVGYLTIS
ncbi:MAG: hypothetical protein PUJ24_05730, partial [Bacteroidales bacterium]|nr:hypothetical protein [Bacteroidales bacterium]